jgi:hypothetical protein
MLVNCIDGPEFAKRLNKAMGKRATGRAALRAYSSDYQEVVEDLERLTQETGSSFDWLRAFQTYLLGDRLVLIARGWDRSSEVDGLWMWIRDEKDPSILKGLSKAEVAELLRLDRIIPMEDTARLRLDPLKDSRDVRVPLIRDLIASGGPYLSRAEDDKLFRRVRPYRA